LDQFDAIDRGRNEGYHPPDRDQALAHFRGQIAFTPDRDQDVGVALGVAGAGRTLGLKNIVADRVHVAAARSRMSALRSITASKKLH